MLARWQRRPRPTVILRRDHFANPIEDEMTNRLIGDRYELLETIGEGGFATTWRAWDTRLERAVAIKVLQARYAADHQFVERFVREAKAAAAVSHPNVVRLYDFGQDREIVFIAMQYVQGQTLRDMLRQYPGGISGVDAIRLITPVLRGLEAIHSAGIVHRDIKPDNILLARDGDVLIADFGIALVSANERLTRTDTTYGTAAYMAPEQARGDVHGPATDIYSVGVVLFELLTGRLPFEAPNPVAMMMAHQEQIPPLVRSLTSRHRIPDQVESAVARALSKRPEGRFQSASAFLTALTSSTPATGTGTSATTTIPIAAIPSPRPSVGSGRPQSIRRRRSLAGRMLLALIAAGSVLTGTLYVTGVFDPSPEPTMPAVIVPTSTGEANQAPTIAAIETATDIPETPTTLVETSTPLAEDQPGIIISAVPETSPAVIMPVDTGDT